MKGHKKIQRIVKTKMKKIVDIKLVKFIIVGVVNTVIGMGIMFGLYNLAGCSYWVSSIANYVLTSILSFFLNKYFTFKHQGNLAASAVKSALNIIVCYVIAYGIAKPLAFQILSSASVAIRENIAMLIGMCLFTGLNYFGQRFFSFKE